MSSIHSGQLSNLLSLTGNFPTSGTLTPAVDLNAITHSIQTASSAESINSAMAMLPAIMGSTAPSRVNTLSALIPGLGATSNLSGTFGLTQGFGIPQSFGNFSLTALDSSVTTAATIPGASPPLTRDDLVNYVLAGSQGGQSSTDERIDGRFADPTSRFANAGPNEFDAVIAKAYSAQFKAYASGLNVVYIPGQTTIEQVADGIAQGQSIQMQPEAELLAEVAATYRGDLTGANLYDNAVLQKLLVSWGRTDLASQPAVGQADVQSIGSVVRALNEEPNASIRHQWLQQIFDFDNNTASSPSGAVPNLQAYQQAISLVRGGALDQLVNNFNNGVKTSGPIALNAAGSGGTTTPQALVSALQATGLSPSAVGGTATGGTSIPQGLTSALSGLGSGGTGAALDPFMSVLQAAGLGGGLSGSTLPPATASLLSANMQAATGGTTALGTANLPPATASLLSAGANSLAQVNTSNLPAITASLLSFGTTLPSVPGAPVGPMSSLDMLSNTMQMTQNMVQFIMQLPVQAAAEEAARAAAAQAQAQAQAQAAAQAQAQAAAQAQAQAAAQAQAQAQAQAAAQAAAQNNLNTGLANNATATPDINRNIDFHKLTLEQRREVGMSDEDRAVIHLWGRQVISRGFQDGGIYVNVLQNPTGFTAAEQALVNRLAAEDEAEFGGITGKALDKAFFAVMQKVHPEKQIDASRWLNTPVRFAQGPINKLSGVAELTQQTGLSAFDQGVLRLWGHEPILSGGKIDGSILAYTIGNPNALDSVANPGNGGANVNIDDIAQQLLTADFASDGVRNGDSLSFAFDQVLDKIYLGATNDNINVVNANAMQIAAAGGRSIQQIGRDVQQGMVQAMADASKMVKDHPFVAAASIGGVAAATAVCPFLGGLAVGGAGIAAAQSLINRPAKS
jgi:hypothetical protein